MAKEDGDNEALEIAVAAVAEVDVSKGERFDKFQETLSLLEKHKNSSEATYQVTRQHYKSILQALLLEINRIEKQELSIEEKSKNMITLLRKGELLLKYQMASKENYIKFLITDSSSGVSPK
jgi:hypothetical protein